MLRIIAIISLTTFLASCGSEGDPDSNLNQSLYADDVKVALGEANAAAVEEYKIAVAFNSAQADIKICEFNGTACTIGTELPAGNQQVLGLRTIYQTDLYLRVDATKTYAVSYVAAGLTLPTYFKFKFQTPGQTVSGGQPVAESATWKALFVTGDNEFGAWDNARKNLVGQFKARNVQAQNIKQLSMAPGEQTGDVGQTSKQNIQSSLQALTGGSTSAPNEHCLVFMTSHGSRQGFFLRNQGTISPSEFGQYLDTTCGDRPTVAIISACYSGVMIDQVTQKPNRIIFTAASRDKTSFGCDASSTYTFFDQCVIETLPKAQDWKTFGELNTACVRSLEQERNMPHFSNPQTFIGDQVQTLQMPK